MSKLNEVEVACLRVAADFVGKYGAAIKTEHQKQAADVLTGTLNRMVWISERAKKDCHVVASDGVPVIDDAAEETMFRIGWQS